MQDLVKHEGDLRGREFEESRRRTGAPESRSGAYALPRKRYSWSPLVIHGSYKASCPFVGIHVTLHFIDNLLKDFFAGDRRNALLDIIQGLLKIQKFLEAGSFFLS